MADFSGTDWANIESNMKTQWADKIAELLPDFALTQKENRIEFVKSGQRPGGPYRHPVEVARENGFTDAPAQSGAFDLNSPSSLQIRHADVEGTNKVLNMAVGYEELSRARTKNQTFTPELQLRLNNAIVSHAFRREVDRLYGGEVGVFPINSDTAPSSTTRTLTSADADWSLGTWGQAQEATVEFRQADGTLVSSGADAFFTVGFVDPDDRQVTFTGTVTGCSALTTALNTVAVHCYFKGAYAAGFKSLKTIMTNTGTLYGLSAAEWTGWLSNTKTFNGGILTFGRIIRSLAVPTSRGMTGKVTVMISPDTWTDVADSAGTQRVFDSSYSKGAVTVGSTKITYYSQNGEVEILPHPLVRNGDAFAVVFEDAVAIGSTDITFDTPGIGIQGSKYFYQLPTNAGVGLRNFSNYNLLLEHPSWHLFITGFENSPSNDA